MICRACTFNTQAWQVVSQESTSSGCGYFIRIGDVVLVYFRNQPVINLTTPAASATACAGYRLFSDNSNNPIPKPPIALGWPEYPTSAVGLKGGNNLSFTTPGQYSKIRASFVDPGIANELHVFFTRETESSNATRYGKWETGTGTDVSFIGMWFL